MVKYFMGGTRYEKFERMMMSPDRSAKDFPSQKKTRNYGRNAREKKKSGRLP